MMTFTYGQRLFSYVVDSDTGFAPNPFWGWCTLATCKPKIRGDAKPGDWVVGLAQKKLGNRVVFFMRVDEVLTIADYFKDERFALKIPDFSFPSEVRHVGDNIYEPLPDGSFRPLPSKHCTGDIEDADRRDSDLGGENVLVGQEFGYFGEDAVELPADLQGLIIGRGHRVRPLLASGDPFEKFLVDQPRGIQGKPSKWPKGDYSWRLG